MKAVLKSIIVALLNFEARLVLWRYKPKIVGITGSVGKTSTKDAIAAVLGHNYSVRKSNKSFNSELGVPLTILGLDTAWNNLFGWLGNLLSGFLLIVKKQKYPEWLVLEMGVDHAGDMARLARWVRLDAAVITRVGHLPVHVEFFPSTEAVLEEKGKILDALRPKGDAFLAYDDEGVRALKEKTKSRVHTFGYTEDADIHADYQETLFENGKPVGTTFKVLFEDNVAPVRIEGSVGRQFIYPILAAVSVGMAEGMNIVEITDALVSFTTPPGRMKLLEGIRGATIIDDTYNSSPIAVAEALLVLSSFKEFGRRIAVLGDMMELGKFSADAHRRAGEEVAASADMLVAVGIRARAIAESARSLGMTNVVTFDTSPEAGEYLKENLKEGDIVLVKGSQFVRLERAVAHIMKEPARASELLVRQGPEWDKR